MAPIAPRAPRATTAAGLLLCLALAAAGCGSQLDPADVRATGSAGQAGTTTSAGSATGSVPGAVAPDGSVVDGAGAGAVAGAPGAPTGAAPAGPTGRGGTGQEAAPGAGAPAVETPSAASCEGLENTTGITDDTIVIGNASDVSGPVPGLFETAQEGTKAFVAFFNATVPEGICGRRLVLKTYDSRTDAGADQQAYVAACDEVFAMVGSQSAFDLGGAQATEDCGLPDIRAGGVTFERNACTTCFPAQAVNTNFFPNAVADFVKARYGDAGQRAGYLFTDAGAAAQSARAQVVAMERRGLDFDVVRGIDISEFNYAPFVQELKDAGVEVVFFTSSFQFSVRLRQAMQQQGYTPKLYLRDPTDYHPDYVELGGSAVEGTVVYASFTPFEEAARSPETGLYTSWLQQVKPGADPQFFGVYAWSAARLFATLAAELGGDLTRESLLAALREVDDWTANDLHSPQPVGSKGTGECARFIELRSGRWTPVSGTDYSCTGLTKAS